MPAKGADKKPRSLPLPLDWTGTDEERRQIRHWRCLNCGQMVFTVGQHPPPDTCDYCADMTTWHPVE